MFRSLKNAVAAAAVGVSVLSSAAAHADPVFNFNLGSGSTLTASLNANAALTVSGTSSFSAVGLNIGVNLPAQTVNINAGVTKTSTPTGTGSIRMADQYLGSDDRFPLGQDGKADDGLIKDGAMEGYLTSLDTRLLSNVGINTNTVNLSGSARTSILGIGVTFPLNASVNANLLIQNIDYNQIGQAISGGFQKIVNYGDGNHPFLPPNTLDLSSQSVTLSTGNINGTAGGNVNASLSTSFLGIGIGLGSQNIAITPTSLTESLGLIGTSKYLEIPTPNTVADDLRYRLDGSIPQLTLPFTLSGQVVIPGGQSFTILDLGFLGKVTGSIGTTTLNYTLNGSVTINQLDYSLVSNDISNAVNVPEASSLTLLGLVAAGSAGTMFVRRRKSA